MNASVEPPVLGVAGAGRRSRGVAVGGSMAVGRRGAGAPARLRFATICEMSRETSRGRTRGCRGDTRHCTADWRSSCVADGKSDGSSRDACEHRSLHPP